MDLAILLLSETDSRKNCYAFSYISMAVFTGFLQHVTYTCDRSCSVSSASFLQLACQQSINFFHASMSVEVEPRSER
jgi:hypothetical protein